MSENIQQTTTPAPEESRGERLFTQADLDRVVGERLARERAASSDYKAKYEAVKQELEGMKAAQVHKAKEDAYRALLEKADISEKRIGTVLKASAAEIDALELDESGAAVGADKLVKSIKEEWADFVATTVTTGAQVAHPAVNYASPVDQIAEAFKPKI